MGRIRRDTPTYGGTPAAGAGLAGCSEIPADGPGPRTGGCTFVSRIPSVRYSHQYETVRRSFSPVIIAPVGWIESGTVRTSTEDRGPFDRRRVAERDTHEELLAADGLYPKPWGVQAGEIENLPVTFPDRTVGSDP